MHAEYFCIHLLYTQICHNISLYVHMFVSFNINVYKVLINLLFLKLHSTHTLCDHFIIYYLFFCIRNKCQMVSSEGNEYWVGTNNNNSFFLFPNQLRIIDIKINVNVWHLFLDKNKNDGFM